MNNLKIEVESCRTDLSEDISAVAKQYNSRLTGLKQEMRESYWNIHKVREYVDNLVENEASLICNRVATDEKHFQDQIDELFLDHVSLPGIINASLTAETVIHPVIEERKITRLEAAPIPTMTSQSSMQSAAVLDIDIKSNDSQLEMPILAEPSRKETTKLPST